MIFSLFYHILNLFISLAVLSVFTHGISTALVEIIIRAKGGYQMKNGELARLIEEDWLIHREEKLDEGVYTCFFPTDESNLKVIGYNKYSEFFSLEHFFFGDRFYMAEFEDRVIAIHPKSELHRKLEAKRNKSKSSWFNNYTYKNFK